MQEIKGTEERFHLMRFWRAEEGICSHLHDIFKLVLMVLGFFIKAFSQRQLLKRHFPKWQLPKYAQLG